MPERGGGGSCLAVSLGAPVSRASAAECAAVEVTGRGPRGAFSSTQGSRVTVTLSEVLPSQTQRAHAGRWWKERGNRE